MELKLPFGLQGDTLKHISEVERGLACDCVCPACKSPLLAKKGDLKTHHFAHHKSDTCEHAVETALHIAAKEVLMSEKHILLPEVKVTFASYKKEWVIFPEQDIQFDDVRLEHRLDNIVPDVMIYTSGRPLMIEVAVTHFVDQEKWQRIKKLGISTLEISLDKFARNPTFDELKLEVVESVALKKWLFNARAQMILGQARRLADRKTTISRGMATHVDECPINARVWHGKSYANVLDDCLYCEYCIEGGLNSMYIYCSGRRKLDSYQDFVKLSSVK